MEGFQKGLFPSKSAASPKSTGFRENGENNENDSRQDKMIPKFQNHRKTVAKNFMSPTISAASKAASPRKKILGERKENLEMFNLNWKNSPQNSSRSYHVSESEDDADFDSSAYDPLKKNYLSPRPKYLRFNPDRRREIAQRLEMEVRDELISSSESLEVNEEQESSLHEIEDSSVSPLKESLGKTEEDDDANTDLEEEEEEDDEEEEEEEKGWCLRGVLKIVLTLIGCLLSTSYICSMNSPTPSPTQQAIWNLRDGYLMIQRQTLDFVNMKMYNDFVHMNMYNGSVFDVEDGDEFSGVDAEVIDDGIEESMEAAIVEDDVEDLDRHENDEDKDYIAKDAEFETDETIIYEYADSFMKEDTLNNIEAEIIWGGEVESETHDSVQLMDAKTDESGSVFVMDSVLEEIPMESKILSDVDSLQAVTEFHGESATEVDEKEDSNLSKSIPEDDTPKVEEELVPSHEEFTEGIGAEMEKKAGWNISPSVIGIFVAASLLSTLLGVVYHSKKTRCQPAKESKSILKPHKFALEEKISDRKVEFLARPSSPPRFMEEARKEELSHHIYAPSVEFLGEIVVGNRRNAIFSTPTKQQQSVTTSFTNDGKILNKEEGGQVGDATPTVTTSVRRSNRLRNRPAASPY